MINEKQFTELYTDITKKAAKIPQECYLGEGNYPIVDQGKGQIAGRWNEVEGLCIEIPAIIFGDHTRAIKYIDEPFFIGADGVKVLRPTNKADNPKYYYYALQAARIPNLGYSRHFKVVKELMIRVYPRADQDKIVLILEKIDEVIEIRQAELSALEQLVKSRFIEMFGMVGSDEKGWGLTRLGDCCVVNPKKSTDNRLYAELMVSFVPMPAVSEKGEIDASETKAYNEVKTGFTYFAEQDVLFAKITPCMENGKGAVARGLCNGIGFGSTEFHILRPIEGITNPYWIFAVTTFEQFRVDAATNMTGSAGQRRVPASFLENYRIAVPPIELQEQFATFVEQIDKSKFEIQESIDKLETLKRSLMQQYFG